MKKLNFRKVASIISCGIMAVSTVGFAAAASYPQPFISGGSANVAIVYGTGSGVSSLDIIQAGNIQSNLQSYLGSGTTGTGSTVTGGDSVALQRPSSLLHVGAGISDVFGRSVISSDMPTLLADGTFRDSSNNDHDYTQKIDVVNQTLSQFDLSNYDSNANSNTPTIGFALDSGDAILNYSLTFQDNVNVSKMANENLNIMGKDYYILTATASKLTLLDSGVGATLLGGDTTTLSVGGKSYDVSVAYIDSSNVKLTINGETTDTLQKGDTYKLSDGSYVGIKDILSQGYSGGISSVDFSIGSGKLELSDGSNIQVNGNSVEGLTSTLTGSATTLSKIVLSWDASDSTAITKDNSITMPTFGNVKLSFGGMTYPSTEVTSVKNDGNTAIELVTSTHNGAVTLDILGMDKQGGTYNYTGKDSTHMLQTADAATLDFNAHGSNSSSSEFVVSWTDGSKEAESYVYKAQNFQNDSGTLKVDLVSQDGGSDVTLTDAIAQDIGVGNIVLTPTIDYANRIVTLAGNPGVSFNKLYTQDGLEVVLPTDTNSSITAGGLKTAAGMYSTSYAIQFYEEDKDGTVGANGFTITVGRTGSAGSYQTYVSDVSNAGTGVEEGDSNVYQYTVASALATMIEWDQGPTQQTAKLTYHGGESYGTLYLTSSTATVTPGSSGTSGSATQLGDVLVKDSEVSSVSSKNLIVVGGSCINSAAATVLGVPQGTCGSSFTDATGIGSGQFLIKGVSDAYTTGKLALVVAGYEAADTVNAAKYLTTQTVDTSQEYKGTSSTSATLVTTTA